MRNILYIPDSTWTDLDQEPIFQKFMKEYINLLQNNLNKRKIDSENALAWSNMGAANIELGRYEQAIDSYQKALEINNEYAGAWFQMGVAYGKLGDHFLEIECYENALKINPHYEIAKKKLEEAIENQSQYQDKLMKEEREREKEEELVKKEVVPTNKTMTEKIVISEISAENSLERGNAYFEQKMYQNAIEEYNKDRSPEAKAKLISIDEKAFKIEFTGSFCNTCGFYDYFDDYKIILEDRGLKSRITQIKEIEKGAIVDFQYDH